MLEAHPSIHNSVAAGRACKDIVSPSMITCLHYLFALRNHPNADDFFHRLATGENISKSDPPTSGVYWIRNRLIQNRTAKAKLRGEDIFPLIVKAWNAYRLKVIVKTLKYSSDEMFPKIQ